ncbi:hypothetical protein V1477_005613 [Vespula maculifrons]|uniref:Uncharacterized protein n=1 Tax=Vespula maculifrons TaxID=7453 RepID=A0ABD2CST0_VESMC
MWMSILSGLETFVSVYAADKVVSESVSDTEKSQTADFDGSLPNTQQLLEMLDSITGMSEEEKADLRADLMKDIQGRASDVQQMPTRDLVNQTFILLSLLAVVALIFGKYRERKAKKSTHRRSVDSSSVRTNSLVFALFDHYADIWFQSLILDDKNPLKLLPISYRVLSYLHIVYYLIVHSTRHRIFNRSLAVVSFSFFLTALDQAFEMGESILENLRNIGALSKKQEEKLIDMLLRLKNLEDQDKKDFMKEAKEFVKEIINDWSSAASFSSSMQSNVLLFLAIFLIFFVIGTTMSRGSDYESELTYVIRN